MKKIPNIRFKGFEGEWAEKKLGELVKERKVSNQTIHHQNLLSLSYGKIVRKDIKTNKGLLPSSFDTYQIIDKDVIVFRGTDLQNDKKSLRVGISEEEGIITPAYICVDKVADDVSAQFLFNQLHFHDVVTKIYYHMGDGLRQTLSFSDLKELRILFGNTDEQQQISSLFSLLDTLISRRSQEVERMRNIKRALLEKMFPQQGESVPQIRFGEFKEKYTEYLAKDTFDTFVEKNHPELPVLSATQDKGMVVREDIGYNITHDKRNEIGYKRVLPGQFVIHLRSFQGGFAHSAVEGITSPAYDVFSFKDKQKHNDYYWKYIFSSKSFIKRLEIVTYGIRDGRNISYPEFLGLKFACPKKQEQTKIAKLLQTLDNTISARERQVTLLKNLKRALLEQMFVNE